MKFNNLSLCPSGGGASLGSACRPGLYPVKGGDHMASGREFVEYAAEQLLDAGNISYRKMFGEYGLYCDGKFFGVICEDQLYVKITPEGEKAFPKLTKAPPYEGARDYFLIEDIDDREPVCELVRITWDALPEPKSRKRRKR